MLSFGAFCWSQELPKPAEDDYVARQFQFRSGEVLPELHLHSTTLGQPVRDNTGRVINVILIAHPTLADGAWYLRSKSFAGELFGPGQLLDATRYYIIAPDSIGHGIEQTQ